MQFASPLISVSIRFFFARLFQLPLRYHAWTLPGLFTLLFLGAPSFIVAQDLYVQSITLDGDQTVSLRPDDPIRYTISYGRKDSEITDLTVKQAWRINVYLSTDGNPDNTDNFLLSFFDSSGAQGLAYYNFSSTTTQTARLPRNFTGSYFLIAAITVTDGSADADDSNNYPSVYNTATARIEITSADSPVVTRISQASLTDGELSEYSDAPSVSSSGRYVVFHSAATDLITSPSVTAGITQVYLRDNTTGTVTLISLSADGGSAGDGNSRYPVISADGKYVVYESEATNLVASDTNGVTDVFVYDVAKAINTLISRPPSSTPANQGSYYPSINDDGSLIVFESDATNLVEGDTNGVRDVFLVERTGSDGPELLSCSKYGTPGNLASSSARISGDGTAVVFRSYATGLVSDKSTSVSDIYVRTLSGTGAGSIARVSLAYDSSGDTVELDRDSYDPNIGEGGRYIVFASRATNALSASGGATNSSAVSQVYRINRDVSDSGTYDTAGNCSLQLISVASDGSFANKDTAGPMISADGRFVGYHTMASNLQYPTLTRLDGVSYSTSTVESYYDNTGFADVYRLDTGISAVTVTSGGSGYTSAPSVTFSGGGGSDAEATAYVEDGVVVRIDITNTGSGYTSAPTVTLSGSGSSAAATASLPASSEIVSLSHFGQLTNGVIGSYSVASSRHVAMSKDGRYIVFVSDADNSGSFIFETSNQQPLDTNAKRDVFMVDLRIGEGIVADDDDNSSSTDIEDTIDDLYQNLLLRTATDDEQEVLSLKFGDTLSATNAAAYMVTTSAFESGPALVLSAHLAVFGTYPSRESYEIGINTIDAGGTIVDYLEYLYGTPAYIATYGEIPDFDDLDDDALTAYKKTLLLRIYKNIYLSTPARQSTIETLLSSFSDALSSGTAYYQAYATNYFLTDIVPLTKTSTTYYHLRVAGLSYTLFDSDDAPEVEDVIANSAYDLDVAAALLTGDTIPAKPAITGQPQGGTYTAGDGITLSVTATGYPTPTYQWYKGKTAVDGATGSSYIISEATSSDAGKYYVKLTNAKGTAKSKTVTIKIVPVSPDWSVTDDLTYTQTITLSVSLDVSVSGTLGEGLAYYASGLPKGLSIDRNTGVISGTITGKPKTYTVKIWTKSGSVKSAVVTITFTVSAFPMTGSYETLLASTDSTPAGKIYLVISNTGAYTGKLYYQNRKTYSLRGTLDLASDQSAAYATQSISKTSLSLSLGIDGALALTAQLYEGDTLYESTDDPLIVSTVRPEWTMSKHPVDILDTDETFATFGDELAGTASITISKKNKLSFSATSADGEKITASMPGSANGEYLLYTNPYKKADGGYFVAALKVSDLRFSSDENQGVWFKPAGAETKVRPEGFAEPVIFTLESQ